MRFIWFLWLILLIPGQASPQEWSDPSVVYNVGTNGNQNFTIDPQGVIHCVWTHAPTAMESRTIFYSRSEDQGTTWISPLNLTPDSNFIYDSPQIVSDTNGILFVTYSHDIGNETMIHLRVFDGTNWGDPHLLSENVPGAQHSRLLVDNSNRIYCFWYSGGLNGCIFYRYFENGDWSPVFQPFPGSDDTFFFEEGVADSMNKLHCIGIHHYQGETPYDDRVIYFTFNNGTWSDYTEISDNTSWYGLDIRLDKNGSPTIVWGQMVENPGQDYTATFLTSLENGNWKNSELIAENATGSAYAMDKNGGEYILDVESIGTTYAQLVSYFRFGSEWQRTVLDSNNRLLGFHCRLSERDTILYLLYGKGVGDNDWGYDMTLLFRKLNIITGYNELIDGPGLALFPNPVTDQSQVEFTVPQKADVTVQLINDQGHTVCSRVLPDLLPGQHRYRVAEFGINTLSLPAGEYILRVFATEGNLSKVAKCIFR